MGVYARSAAGRASPTLSGQTWAAGQVRQIQSPCRAFAAVLLQPVLTLRCHPDTAMPS